MLLITQNIYQNILYIVLFVGQVSLTNSLRFQKDVEKFNNAMVNTNR